MQPGFDPGALLARTYALPGGPRVTLRLARSRDRAGIEALLRAQPGRFDELEAGRLVNFDVTGTVVLCATALIDGREQLVGFGAIDLAATGKRAAASTFVRPELAAGLDPLLRDALLGHADVMRRARRAA